MKLFNFIVVFFLGLNLLTISLVVNNTMALPNPYSTSSMGQGSSALSGDQSSFASSMRPGQGSELGSSALSGDQSSFASSMRPGGSTEPQSGLQQMNFGFSSSMQSRILHDDLQGHSVGWNPGGPSKTFIISDSSINPKTSLVLINTVQSNFVICSVDYLATGFFEVNCNVSPANNAELHYLVINGNAVAGEMSSGNVTSRIQNNTQANIQVPRELSKNPNQLIDEINSTSTAMPILSAVPILTIQPIQHQLPRPILSAVPILTIQPIQHQLPMPILSAVPILTIQPIQHQLPMPILSAVPILTIQLMQYQLPMPILSAVPILTIQLMQY